MQKSPQPVCIYRAANAAEGIFLRDLIGRKGIPAQLIGENLAGSVGALPVQVLEVEIHVSSSQAEAARNIVEAYEARLRKGDPLDAGPRWVCTCCREINESTFEICWNCQTGRET